MNNNILVVGSMNMDLVVETERMPLAGETLLGKSFNKYPGGKGANQAVAAAKLDSNVSFIGACGKDEYGKLLSEQLLKNGVNLDVVETKKVGTGVAIILVEDDGENRIIINSGANSELTPEIINNTKELFKKSDYLLLQLEIPLETTIRAIELGVQYNLTIILDPAPAVKLPYHLYEKIDYIVPNQLEIDFLTPSYLETEDKQVEWLLNKGVKNILLTKGAGGVTYYSSNKVEGYKAIKVKVVDSTAAGDTFVGAFCSALSRGYELNNAILFANLAAAFSVTKFGAQSSIPNLKDIKEFSKKYVINLKFEV